jgi:hypothetical protein
MLRCRPRRESRNQTTSKTLPVNRSNVCLRRRLHKALNEKKKTRRNSLSWLDEATFVAEVA